MNINNAIYKLKNDIAPFKTAIFAVIISIWASVSVSAVSETGKQIITNEMDSMGMNGLAAVIYSNKGENITDKFFYQNVSGLNESEYASPIITENAEITFSNDTIMPVMCWGVDKNISNIISLEVITGRMIEKQDVERNARVCLVDENIADAAYKRDNICGKKILVNIGDKTTEFTIIGTIRKSSNVLNSITGDIVPNFIYIPYTTMMDLSSKTSFDQVLFTGNNTENTINELKSNLIKMDFRYKNNIINITDLSHQKEQLTKIVDTAFMSLFIVSCVAVLVCSMSVGASVNTAVISRQKDIGIKISMGAGQFNIIIEFMISAIMSCIIGILSAIIFMVIALKLVSFILEFNITIDLSLIALSVFATIMLTSIFSFLPSCKAAKMPPIKALNRE